MKCNVTYSSKEFTDLDDIVQTTARNINLCNQDLTEWIGRIARFGTGDFKAKQRFT